MLEPATSDDEGPSSSVACVSTASALNTRERLFCEAFVTNGGKGQEAALAAGYSDSSASVAASRLLCRKRVAAHIQYLCRTFIHAALPVAIQTLIEIASDPAAAPKDRIKAANSLLERGGMATEKAGVQVNVGVQVAGGQVQQLISSIWDARQQRLSDIPPAMTDNEASVTKAIEALEATAIPAPAEEAEEAGGGSSFRVPAPVPVPIPAPSHTQNEKAGNSDAVGQFNRMIGED